MQEKTFSNLKGLEYNLFPAAHLIIKVHEEGL